MLEIEFADGSKIIVNRHGAAREIWVAARSGGFHFRWDGAAWRDTRDGTRAVRRALASWSPRRAVRRWCCALGGGSRSERRRRRRADGGGGCSTSGGGTASR